jgi:glycosyltransferase involved in cell wall biosynthesis
MQFILGANIDDSHTTGMGRQMHGLGDALAARGHRVDFLFSDRLKSPFGRRMSRLEAPLRAAFQVNALARKVHEPSVAILHEPIGWPTALFAKRQATTIAMVHNCEQKCWRIKLETRKLTGERVSRSARIVWPLSELTQSYASLKSAAGVLCLSSEDRTFICDKLGVPTDRVARVDNGLEPRFMGLPFVTQRPRDVLFLGHWLPHKGIRILVEALRAISEGGVSFRLTLAGTGLSIEEIAEALSPAWRANVEIIPYIPPEQLTALYMRHRIFVLPSVTEGIPLSMLEAMACGVCPIVSDVGGVRDVVDPEKTGMLVPRLDSQALARALMRAMAVPEQTEALGRRAQAVMQEYGWDRAAAQVLDFCRDRIASRRRSLGTSSSTILPT